MNRCSRRAFSSNPSNTLFSHYRILNPFDSRELPENVVLITEHDPPAGLTTSPGGKIYIHGTSEAPEDDIWPYLVVVGQRDNLALMRFLTSMNDEPADAARESTDKAKGGEAGRNHADLSATDRAVLAIIKAMPRGQGISAKEIIAKLKSKRIKIAFSSLRKHVLPKLKAGYGVVNHRAAGGYLIS